jgi:putative molybdopterin biosynthesis protein
MGRRTETADLQNNVRAQRITKGLSQHHLAEQAGITRQAIVAIEAGHYTPNTAVALRLAQALACRVEDLFVLPDRLIQRRAASAGGRYGAGTRVVVANVGDRLVAHQLKGLFAPADGVALNAVPDIQLFITPEQAERTAFLVGCDPSLGMLAAWVSRRAGDARLVWLPGSSQAALDALRHSTAHVAGIHLRDPKTGEFNVPQARRALAKGGGLVVSYAGWEQGFIVQRGNPKKLGSVDALSRRGVRLINRELGSGSRALLDQLLAGACISPETIAGYDRVVSSHIAVARAVADGAADVGIGLRAVASAVDADFLPLADARFDFLIPSEHLDHPAIKVLLDVMQSTSLRAQLSALPGYSTSETGTVRERVGAVA